jgi:hypothetical protein
VFIAANAIILGSCRLKKYYNTFLYLTLPGGKAVVNQVSVSSTA